MISNDEALENIAANLRRLLDDKGWNQADLARATGESEMQVSRWIRGTQMPSAAALFRLTEALGVPSDKLKSPPPKKIQNRG